MPENRPTLERLPIKLIMPKQGTERRVVGGGPPATPFRTVDNEYRQRLASQLDGIQAATIVRSQVEAVPARVKLHQKAMAKSHRPTSLFSADSCPIIGAGTLGELFVKVTPAGLLKLATTIRSNDTDKITKEISSVDAIEPITPAYRRKGLESQEILKESPRGSVGFITRVRLFNFGGGKDQEELVDDLRLICQKRRLRIDASGYSASSYTYAIECRTTADVDALSRTIGVKSIGRMPLLRIMRPTMLNMRPLPKLPGSDRVDGDYPVVVVVDTGISEKLAELESWVVGRKTDVAPQYQNTDHGTFVAGLIVWGSDLNPTLDGIDSNPCGVFDLQLIPNNDPDRGDTDTIIESEFLQSLESAIKQYANQYKVWNLSLGTDSMCSLDEFSPLAEELDNFQEKYKISFVISAGNYDSSPLLDYPRTPRQLKTGRITSPADSVLGITVGSISHVDYKANGPKEHHPSAFSRHGPGPNHVITPDVVHYGGSCSTNKSHVAGIQSIYGNQLAENIGTSFATPLVSRTLAQIYHHITPTPSPVLARAILTHNARDPRTRDRVPDGDENFFGFGRPATVAESLQCTPYTSTLVFDDVLRPGYYLEWDDFPYPPSLHRNGRYFGEIWMTIAFAPTRGSRWGSEYCETHVDAHFGVYRDVESRESGAVTTKFFGLVPPEHKNKGVLFESYQVEKLRKWSPVRTYFGDLGEKGERGSRWRLKLQLLTRHGNDDESAYSPQPFSLIVTICDPTKKAHVYDEMARIVLNRFQAQNLTVRASARIRR
jgi:hypothetical protein